MGFIKWLWNDIKMTLKDNSGIWPLLVGAAIGGLGGYFGSKARQKAAKPIDPNLTPVKPASSFGDYTTRQSLVNRISADPASYADVFEKEVATPRRNLALNEFDTQTIPAFNQAYSARGLGRSSLAGRDIGRARTNLGLQLAMARGQDRTKGLETGFQQRQFKSGELGSLANFAAQQANARSAQSAQQAQFMIPQQQAYRKAGADIWPSAIAGAGQGISTAGTLSSLGMFGGGSPNVMPGGGIDIGQGRSTYGPDNVPRGFEHFKTPREPRRASSASNNWLNMLLYKKLLGDND